MQELTAISPIDGRYHSITKKVANYFSEMALQRYRLLVEVEYLIALKQIGVPELSSLSFKNINQLRALYNNFSLADALKIKEWEKQTNHDVKAIEYFLKEKLTDLGLTSLLEFVHFGLTSEDTNNLAYALMWTRAIKHIYLPALEKVWQAIKLFAQNNADEPMLALTHGQSASPTTVGKEFAVFASRLQRQINQLTTHKLLGKINGATGTYGAHYFAYPKIDWLDFSQKFITRLGLEPNLLTTQIEPHDSLAESFSIIERINNILIDFTRDVWFYISRGVLGQKPKENEVGSSTMPHKINPINFENAEGNLGLVNAFTNHLANKLLLSRLQRDLSDSTVMRNQGVIIAYCLIAYHNINQGMARLTINQEKLQAELDNHWEILAEPIQTILRQIGYDQPYEKLKELTRGRDIQPQTIKDFIENLDIPMVEKNKLRGLTPQNYLGLAQKLANLV